ncbi:SGNH/GDSL hydrolase family protein [Ferruginivarius sediminum]|nr:SGNH/GDSL hydrolase family protein [Ferruginivarius sediminum]
MWDNREKVIFFGDSICFGQGVSPHRTWVTRVSADVEALGARHGVALATVNTSINGNTTRMALERMPFDVQSHRPDFLVVQFGMNDCNFWRTDGGVPRVSQEGFRANLKEIVKRGQVFGARNVFLLTNHPTTLDAEPMAWCDITYQASNIIYNRIIRELAAELELLGVTLIDVEKHFDAALHRDSKPLGDYLLSDGLHLGSRGHDLYYEAVAPRLLTGLEQWYLRTPSSVSAENTTTGC